MYRKENAMVKRKILYAMLIVMWLTCVCFGWGAAGHKITAAIASSCLTDQARVRVTELLMADLSPWADTILYKPRGSWKHTKKWHWINIPRGEASVHYDRDCNNGGCVVSAITQQVAILRDGSATKEAHAVALKFLVHFVGDVHQPMHVAYRKDKGGGKVKLRVTFKSARGRKSDLHKMWDTELIQERTGKDWAALAHEIRASRGSERYKKLAAEKDPTQWANESLAATIKIYDELPANKVLGKDYYENNVGTVENRLVAGGVRLAVLLNDIFADE
jgi:hypothetical protein